MARTGLVVATPVIGQRTGAGETRAPERRGAAPASVVAGGLHGANAYSAVSMLVVRLATDETGGLAGRRRGRPRRSTAELLAALDLSAAEVRARTRWPVGSLVQTIAEASPSPSA